MVITRRGLRVVHALAWAAVAGVVLASAALVSALGGEDDAWARMRGDAALTSAPCPSAAEAALASASPRRIEAAREGRFEVFGDEPTELELPIDWTTDPLGAHRYRQNLHKLRFVEPLLWSYAVSADLDDLRHASEIVLDWVEQNPLDGEGVPAEAWADKVIGDRAPYVAYTLRAAACEAMLSRDERRSLLGSIGDHARALASQERFVPDNHGLFVDLGLLRLVEFFPFLEHADDWRDLARERFESTLRGRLSEGVWLEHSSAYQLLAIRAVEAFLAEQGGDEELGGLLLEMREAAAWFVRPDGEITQFGDSNLEPVPEWAGEGASELAGMRVFFDAGFAFVRVPSEAGELGYLAVTDGFHNHTHKHADELSFELFDRGVPVVTDTGLYDKDPGPVRDFVVSVRSHSVLTVDQLEFPIEEQGAVHGSGLLAAGEGDGWYAIEGRNPLVRPQGVRHRRLFLYRPGVALLIVDWLASDSPHTYTRYLQLGPEIEQRPAGDGLAIEADGLEGQIHDLDTGAPVTRTQARGQEEPKQGFTSPDFREFVPRWSVAYVDQATSETRVLSISLDGSGLRAEAVDAGPDGITLELVDDAGGTSAVTASRDGREIGVAAR